MYDISNRGEFERALEFFHPDVELIVPATLPDPGVYVGRREMFGWFRNWYVMLFESWHVEIVAMTQVGDAVVIEHRLHGKGRGSGAEVMMDNASVNTVRGGLIVRVQPQASLADAQRVAEEEAARTVP